MIQSGRSMLEMLTVLAVVGILSIIALIGVPYLMNKNQANKVISDASSVYAAVESTEIRYPDWTEYPITAESGFVFKVIRAEEKGVLVTYVQAIEVPEKICKHMLNMKGEKLSFYDVREYEDFDDEEDEDEDGTGKAYYVELAEKTVCEELNNIGITFDGNGVGGVMAFHAPGNEEGSEGGNVSSPGVIDPEDPPCEADLIEITKCDGTKVKCCPDGGNVCVSPTDCCTSEASCAGIGVKCIENECRCPDGYFQNANLNCTECTNFAEKEPISEYSCLSCNPDPSNPTVRKMSGGKCVPFDKNNCPSGKYKGRIGTDNLCFDCSDPRAYLPTSGSCPSACSAEREMIGSNCVRRCSGEQFRAGDGTCHDCTEMAGTVPAEGECSKCGSTREMVGNICGLKCPSGQFRGSNGSCYYCTETSRVIPAIGECSKCSERAMSDDNYCFLKNVNCGNGSYLNSLGACEPCPAGAICNGKDITGCAVGYAPHGDASEGISCCNSSQYWNGSYCSFCPSNAICSETGVESCGEGRYMLDEGGCYVCPSDAECDGTSIDCGGNKYLYYDHETNSCKPCPNNARCDGTKAICNDGMYLNNAGVCRSCPNNATCVGGGISCNNGGSLFEKNGGDKYCCNTNQYWNGNGCSNCSGSMTCVGGRITNCGSGKYLDAGSCKDCPTNAEECDGVTVVKCPEGKYKSGNGCYDCPSGVDCDGSYCPNGYTLHVNLSTNISHCCSNVSEYWNGSKCVSCPSGVSCNGTDGTCGNGYVTHITSSGNIACCKSNQYWISDSCKDCPKNVATCNGTSVTCNSGYVSHTYASKKQYSMLAMTVYCCHETNQYWTGSKCADCSGAKCDGTRITSCNSGQYWNGSSCADCPSNATCDGTNVPKCGTGKFWGSTQKCEDCEDLYRIVAYNDAECLSCGTRELTADGYCDWRCPLGWFKNTNGNCTRCFNQQSKDSTQEECDKCNYPGSPHVRTYYNGSCQY